MTNAQAGNLPNERLRVRAEQLRALYGRLLDDHENYTGELKDYFEPTTGTSTWTDNRTDVPHTVNAAEIAAFQTLIATMLSGFTADTLALLAKFCVRPLDL